MENTRRLRSLALVLVLCLLIGVLPMQFAVEAEAVSGVNSLTCKDFISDSTRQIYIDTMMRYYINNNSKLANTLDDGDSVVFMFEGGSDNYDSYSYVDAAGSVRVQAVCIVVQKNSSGNAEIVFYSENCSSIPCDANWVTPGYETSGSTTILDGIYAMYNCNHNGNYAAFTTSCTTGWYTPYDGTTGYAGYCNGINIHTRSGNYCGGASYGWANSAGCQVIGYGTSNNAFNEFMKVTTGITWNSYGTYHNTFSSTGYFYGYYVVDRQLGLLSPNGTEYGSGSLNELYTKTDLKNITAFSTEARANANFGYLSECTPYPAHCQIEITSATDVNSLPCSVSSGNDSELIEAGVVGTKYTAQKLYKNAAGNLWYEVTTSSGNTAYVYAGHAKYIDQIISDISLSSGATSPNGHVAGNVFVVNGTISSKNNELTSASVYIHEGFGTSGTKVTGDTDTVGGTSYTLDNSTIDYNTSFNSLDEGKYTYAISTEYINYYATSATTMESNTGTINLMEDYFVVISASADQSTCSHSYTTTTAQAATCTESGISVQSCSKCGKVNESVVAATGHTGSWVTVNATCTTDGSKTRTCTTCGHVDQEVAPATGHSYTTKTVAGNCKVHPHVEHTCSKCGDAYNTFDSSITSAWSTTKPSVDASLIETKTQYRYSDYETKTSYETSLSGYTQVGGEWDTANGTTGSVQYVDSWPSGFDTSSSLYSQYNKKSSKVTSGETATTKTVVTSDSVGGYLYYHWCYADSYYSSEYKNGSYTTFHAYYSTTNPDSYTCDTSDMSYKTANTSCCSNSDWFFVAKVNTQKYTSYPKLFTYERWTNWSAWSDTAVKATDTRKVETQKLYRYVTAELGEHNYVNGVCTICGDKQAVTTPAVALTGEFNNWSTTDGMTMDGTNAKKTIYLTPDTYEFKVIEGGVYMGNTGTIVDTTATTSGIGWQMTETGNCKLKVTIPGNYTFTYKTETNYLVVTSEYDPLYLRGSFNDWGTANVLTNNGNRTYSTTMTLDAGNYTYKVGTSDWTAAWPSEDKALNLTAKSEVTVTLTLKADGNHEVTHTIKPLGSTTTYTCQLAALEVSCDAEVLLRMKMIIGDSIINNDKSYVVMTKDGEDTIFTAADLRAMGTDNKGRYVLEQGIASGEMTYDVTVKIYNGNGQLENIYDYATGAIGTSVTRNVMDYAERIFNLGTQEQKNLIAALVTYGGYSQLHFNTDAGNPAYNALTNCGMSIPNIQSITADSFTQQISRTGNAIGITQTNTRVFLDSAIYMRAYFVLDAGKSIDDYTFTLTYSVNNNERTKTLEPGYDAVNNRYYVDIEDIAAAYLDYMYTITVTNGSGTYVVKTSAMAWAKLAMQATTDVNQINMIKAMYYYNQAANTYFGK